MTVAQVIHPGDRIEINEIKRGRQRDEMPCLYRSKVLDVMENGNIEIAMPTEKGKLVLLTLGVRFDFVFFCRSGLYRAVAQVKERYKKDNIYMLEIELKSQLEKFQRREFYRYPCIMKFDYYLLTKEEAECGTGEAIYIQIRNEELKDKKERAGQIIDLSGGGVKFITEGEIEEGQYMLLLLHLRNEELNKLYYIIGNIIACQESERSGRKCYEARVKFMIQDNNVQEDIIRYIFEEERKTRQRSRR